VIAVLPRSDGSFDGTRLTRGAVLDAPPATVERLRDWDGARVYPAPSECCVQVEWDSDLLAYVIVGSIRATPPDVLPVEEYPDIPGIAAVGSVQVLRSREDAAPMLRPEDFLRPSWEQPEPEPEPAAEPLPARDPSDGFEHGCPYCPRAFPSSAALERHHEFVHEVVVH
jgi:hypothetical protein